MKGFYFKRKIFIAISILTMLTLLLTAFAGCSSKSVEINKVVGVDAALGDEAFAYMQTLAADYPARTMGASGDIEAAGFLSDTMTALGYTSEYSHAEKKGIQAFKTTFSRYVKYAGDEELKDVWAYNVIFTKKTAAEHSKGEILLTCQYDNLYSEKADMSAKPWAADGSYESGAAVAIVLTLANKLKDVDLGYDLTFAFFTGGSYCWRGALQYASQLDRTHLDNIKLVLNYGMLGGGENWYIYDGESATSYGGYLNACANGASAKVPNDRNIAQFILEEDSLFNYVNVGMLSNQHYFMNRGVPTANFLSLNWESNSQPLFTEMNGESNVYHTQDDTLAKMIERKGEDGIKKQLQEVIAASLTALNAENIGVLSQTLENAEKEFPNATAQNAKTSSLVNVIFKAVVIALLIAASYVIKQYVFKNADKILPSKEEVQTPEEPFENANGGGETFDKDIDQKQEKDGDDKPFEDPFA